MHFIIGGGPTGVTLFKTLGGDVKLFEGSPLLGGAHAVRRVDGLFSEHGPKVYSTNYHNAYRVFPELGRRMVPYNFQISEIGGAGFSQLSWGERLWFVLAYFTTTSRSTETVGSFSRDMSAATRDYLDRLTRFTDGSGADRYPLSEFLGLANAQAMYQLVQPAAALDTFWAAEVHPAMTLGAQLERVDVYDDRIVSLHFSTGAVETVRPEDTVVLALPPVYLKAIAGLPLSADVVDWIDRTAYIDYISVTFHWNGGRPSGLTETYGFPKSAWNVAYIDLGKYLEGEPTYVLSTAITDTDRVPSGMADAEIVLEVARQLGLPPYDRAIVYRGPDEGWVGNEYRGPGLLGLVNTYSVGCHNGRSAYPFTSFEAAVQNALHFCGAYTTSALTLNAVLVLVAALLVLLFKSKILFVLCLYATEKESDADAETQSNSRDHRRWCWTGSRRDHARRAKAQAQTAIYSAYCSIYYAYYCAIYAYYCSIYCAIYACAIYCAIYACAIYACAYYAYYS